jgi:putative MATE family efflux protein
LAVPVVIAMLMEFALSVTDFFWVGRLGPVAQDAITSSMVIHWTMFGMFSLISIGTTALVSRYVGAQDYEKVRFYVRQTMQMTILFGIILSIVGYILTPWCLSIMDTSEATLQYAVPYLRIFFVSIFLFALAEAIYGIFRASGDTRTPTKIAVVAVAANIILDPILIHGYGPFPRLEVPGAAIATTVSVLIASSLAVWKIRRGDLGYDVPRLFGARPNFRAMGKIAGIGLPISTQQVTFVVVYWFLIAIVHKFGPTAGAAMGIGNRMESFAYLTCSGFAIAAATMVGQNLGAGNPDRAARCAWGAVGLAVGLTSIISVFFLTVPDAIVSIFTDNADVKRIAVGYLMILGLSQVTMALEIVLEGAFSGSGNTIPPMVVMIPGAVVRIPLAYFLCFTLDWGINGVWWTLTITTSFKSLILAYWFWLGRWKRKKL